MLCTAQTLKGYTLDSLDGAIGKPTTLLAMFNAPQLAEVAQEVEDTIVTIMKEAASG
jgi:hypothetical protein